jgi:LPS sulfotransferase NodH
MSTGQHRPQRFVIMGLPRSGSTYLMTLLGSHPQIFCTGEQFNPWAVVGTQGDRDDTYESVVLGRDARPEAFLQDFYDTPRPRGTLWSGFKFMLGHNLRAFNWLAGQGDLALIYVWRANRLAQAASYLKAVDSKRWAQNHADDHIARKIQAPARYLAQLGHEAAMTDMLFQHWFKDQPRRKFSVEYSDMFTPGFPARICDFLGVDADQPMKSPLVKQGANTILDRFEDPQPIRNYFTRTGHSQWLENEL